MRRFIAGAVCPQCRAVDRLVVETVLEALRGEPADDPAGEVANADRSDPAPAPRRICVNCGFSDDLGANTPTSLPNSRVEGGHLQARPVAASVVKILQPEIPGASSRPRHKLADQPKPQGKT